MPNTLSLLLPVLFPSWRFFKEIAPSPRVQWTLLSKGDEAPAAWQEFRPRPLTITPLRMAFRLLWNPGWNDTLFVVSCAERIYQQPTAHSVTEIMQRIQSDIEILGVDTGGRLLQFRLVFVHREGAALEEQVVFISDPFLAKAPK